jgi:RHS repeat-associated protein
LVTTIQRNQFDGIKYINHQRLANFTQRRTLSINVAGRIDAIDPDFGVGSLPSNQRGLGQWVYTQDKRGQITSGQRIWRADSMVEGALPPRVSYTYDELGNRLTSTAYKDIGTTTADATTYAINDLNQYASRANARGLIISGMAPQDQPLMLTVKTDLNLATPNTALNNQPAERQGTLFARRIAFTSTAEWAKIDINATGGDPSRTARTLGNRWVPPQTEAMTYDADGNLTGDARWIYRWDGEGRLSELETKATAGAVGLPMVKLVFGYDAGSRRVMKRVYANLGGTTTAPIWVLQNDVRFVYVGWHMIAEVEIKGSATDAPAGGGANPPPFLRRSWLWGEDLTGTAPAAVGDQRKLGAGGGVGGLLAVTRHARGDQPAESYWATSDLNGNVIGLLATSSTKTAVYDYDPFGQPIRVNEPEAGLNPVRFSSKYTDAETGLCYYGFRYYQPETGRWLSRDPLGERGGKNLYQFCYNDGINWFDYLGWTPVNGGISVPNGSGPTANGQNSHFDDVARDGADKGKNQRANSGKEMLDFLQELSKNSCCIKKLTVAGHGWDSVQRDGTPAGDGPGLPGVADGSGLYEDGPSGDRWATDPNARRLSDLEKDIADGKTTFCKPCEVRIHACNISSSFAEKLGSITKCKVIYARGACSGRRPWKSGVGKEPGGNTPENGFWQSDGGLPSTPTGNSYRP